MENVFLEVFGSPDKDQAHQENMSTKIYPLKPHFYIEKWGLQGYTYFSYFCSKT